MVKLMLLKLIRDIKKSLVTYMICIFIIATGLAGFSVMSISMDNLVIARDTFFIASTFSDVFTYVQSAPKTVENTLQKIDGIKQVEGRLVKNVQLTNFEQEEVQVQMVSIADNLINKPMVLSGMLPQPGKYELLLGDGMFKLRGLKIGDGLEAVINGKKNTFAITGSGISPETIYMVKNANEIMADPNTYDAAYLPYDVMSALFASKEYVNSFVIVLEQGYRYQDVEQQLKDVLEPYGLYSIYPRKDQYSNSMLQAELDQLKSMSKVVPFLFLFISAIIMFISLKRLVESQRTQIGTIKAIGFSDVEVVLHYVSYGGVIGFLGGILGGIAGSFLSIPMFDMYRTYFSLPPIDSVFSIKYFFTGIVLSVVFCAMVSWVSVKSVMHITPAAALRPASPKSSRKTLFEKIPYFIELFNVQGRVAIRSLSRNYKRSLLALIGIAYAYMITAVLVSTYSLIDVFMFDYLEKTQLQDISINFSAPVSKYDALRIVRDSEVEIVEGVTQAPINIKGVSEKIEAAVLAIPKDSKLYKLYDEAGSAVDVENYGMVISKHMAQKLNVSVGDSVEVEITYPKKRTSQVIITGIVAQYMGSNAYMSYEALANISSYTDAYTSLYIKAPERVTARLKDKLTDSPIVNTVEHRMETVNKYRKMMGNYNSIMYSMALMGVMIGFAVIYTSSLISFEELKREILTMMTLGLSSKESLEVISVEQWFLSIGGILLGIPMTIAVSKMMTTAMASELYSIPDFVDIKSIFFSIVLTFIAVIFSSYTMHRKLKKLKLIDMLRERE